MKRGLAELLAEIGNENIEYQLLSTSITASKDAKSDTEITFATNQISTHDVAAGIEKEAIIVWVDREQMMEAASKLAK